MEPELIIPPEINLEKSVLDFSPGEYHIFIPLPNEVDKGIYVNSHDLSILLRANKANPEAIQYIADLMD